MDDGTNFYRSFSLLLALQYLRQEDIVPKPAAQNSDWVQLGKTVIHPFESYDGGYGDADAQGCQFLLDLERGKNVFPAISFGSVLAGSFNTELVQDHIVRIGVVAQGVKDYFYTSQCGTLMVCPPIPGIELHGYMVHQLLRLAKEEGYGPHRDVSRISGGSLDRAMGARGRIYWRVGSRSMALLSGSTHRDPTAWRGGGEWDDVWQVNSVYSSSHWISGQCHGCDCLALKSGKAGPDASNVTFFPTCFAGGGRGCLGKAGAVPGERPAAPTIIDCNDVVYRS
ncbi:MAG TPA: CHASE2 domain-containing protein [Nitrospirales bacterium]|nr:CHASE2 domain-containing protein [Nitrospirales bacterium]